MGINESFATNSTVPQLVPDLADQEIITIDVGAEHVVALSNKGQVFSWGMNNEVQNVYFSSMNLYSNEIKSRLYY